jgi:hypothetical protein
MLIWLAFVVEVHDMIAFVGGTYEPLGVVGVFGVPTIGLFGAFVVAYAKPFVRTTAHVSTGLPLLSKLHATVVHPCPLIMVDDKP